MTVRKRRTGIEGAGHGPIGGAEEDHDVGGPPWRADWRSAPVVVVGPSSPVAAQRPDSLPVLSTSWWWEVSRSPPRWRSLRPGRRSSRSSGARSGCTRVPLRSGPSLTSARGCTTTRPRAPRARRPSRVPGAAVHLPSVHPRRPPCRRRRGPRITGPGPHVAAARVTANPSPSGAPPYTRAIAGSEVVLLGTNSVLANIGNPNDGRNTSTASCMSPKNMSGTPVEDCIPSDENSHTIGTVTFAPDGSLLVSSGDGSNYSAVDHVRCAPNCSTAWPARCCESIRSPASACRTTRTTTRRTRTATARRSSLRAAQPVPDHGRPGIGRGVHR